MSRWNPISRRLARICLGAASLLVPAIVGAQTPPAQTPWAVTLTPSLDPLPVGFCAAIQLTVLDASGKDAPRNALGARVTIADFDITVTGNGVVADRIDAFHWVSCACQSAKPASTATVTVSYPSRSLAADARVAGVTLQRAATFTISAAKGTSNPRACTAEATPSSPPSSASTAGTLPQPLGVPAVPRTPPAPAPAAPPVGVAVPPTAPPVALATPPAAPPPAPVGTLPQPIGVPVVPRTPPAPAPSAPPVAVALPPTAPPVALAPVPINPSGFTAVQIAPGQVRLSWQAVGSASFYGLFGPGLIAGGEKIVGATTFVATNVPAGSQQWAVATYIDPGNVSTPAAEFPRVTLTVTAPAAAPPPASAPPPAPAPPPATTPPAAPAPSGRYLVTVVGLRAYQASADDLLSRDGVGDEVYAAAHVRRYDQRTGQLVAANGLKSAVYGDVNNNYLQRIQAGSRSATGGVQDGDVIPTGPLVAIRSTPAQASTFPWRLFEGTLTNGVDALVITPSIWEQDFNLAGQPNTQRYDDWVAAQQTLNMSLFARYEVQQQITQKVFGLAFAGAQGGQSNTGLLAMLQANQDQMFITTLGVPLISLLSTSADRPFGLVSDQRDSAVLPNQVVVLTREIIEAGLALPAFGAIPSPLANAPSFGSGGLIGTPPIARIGMAAPKPGILVVQFEDRNVSGALGFPERPAIYQMFIQVERVP